MQQRSEETRGKILQAALTCFSRSGYDATGVAEICSAAGVSKGAFYHHFSSKQAVFLALLNEWLAGLDARFAAIRAEAGCVADALSAMAATARQVFEDARGQLPLVLEFWMQSNRDPAVWAVTVEPYQRYEDYFARLLRAGIADGSIRPVDPQSAARAIIAMAIGLLVQSVSRPGSTDWPVSAQEGIDLLLTGIRSGRE